MILRHELARLRPAVLVPTPPYLKASLHSNSIDRPTQFVVLPYILPHLGAFDAAM